MDHDTSWSTAVYFYLTTMDFPFVRYHHMYFVPYLCYRWGLQTCFIQSLDYHSTTADPEQFSLSGSCFSSRLLCRRWGFAVSRIQRFKLDKFIPWLELFSCDLGRVGVSESVVPPFTWWTASSWLIVLFVWITHGILRKIPPPTWQDLADTKHTTRCCPQFSLSRSCVLASL